MDSNEPRRPVLSAADIGELQYLGLLSPEIDGWYFVSPDVIHSRTYVTGVSRLEETFRSWIRLPNELKEMAAECLSDVDMFSLSSTSTYMRDLFRRQRTIRRKAFLKVPALFHTYQTFEYLGFSVQRAKSLLRQLEIVPACIYTLIDSIQRVMHEEHDAHPEWHPNRIHGLNPEFKEALRDPAWQPIRRTQARRHWFWDTVSIRFNAPFDISSASFYRQRSLYRFCGDCQSCRDMSNDRLPFRLLGSSGETDKFGQSDITCLHFPELPRCRSGMRIRYWHSYSGYRHAYGIKQSPTAIERSIPQHNSLSDQVRLYLPTTLHQIEAMDLCPTKRSLYDLARSSVYNSLILGLIASKHEPIVLYEWPVAEALARYAERRGGGYTKGVVLEILLPVTIFQHLEEIAPYDIDLYVLKDSVRQTMFFPAVYYRGLNHEQEVPEPARPLRGVRLRNYKLPDETHSRMTITPSTERKYFQVVAWDHHNAAYDRHVEPLYTPKVLVGSIPMHWCSTGVKSSAEDVTPECILWCDDIPSKKASGPNGERSKPRTWYDGADEALQFIFPWRDRLPPYRPSPSREEWCSQLEKSMELHVRDVDWEPVNTPGIIDGREFRQLLSEWKRF